MSVHGRSVVVGVDWSDTARAAVEVAAEAAWARRLPLRLVHVLEPPVFPVRPTVGRIEDLNLVLRKAGQRLFDEVREVLALTYPELRVSTSLLRGSAPEELVAASLDAELLVVGARGGGVFTDLVLGSTAVQTASLAACPVLVVPAALPADLPGHGVVVGVDGSARSLPALDFAFRTASLYGEPLIAVHAWTTPARTRHGEQLPVVYDIDLVAREEGLVLAESMAGFAEEHPDVKVDTRVVHDHPVHALISAEPAARLLVVGSRGHGPLGALLLGSVSQGVLHHATCPTVVVPHSDRRGR